MKKILIIQPASIGDVILATPIIEKLHRFFPDASIDFLLKKGNEGLFIHHPFLHRVITWDKSRNKYLQLYRILQVIRSNKYDAVINVQRFLSSGILTGFSGAGIRTGFSKNPLSFLFTSRIHHQIESGIHEVDRNLKLIEDFTDDLKEKPKLYPSAADFNSTARYKSVKYYTISPASLWFTKQFPPEKWAEVLKLMNKDIPVMLLGSEADKDLCDDIIYRSGNSNAENLAGKLSFLESAALMKDALMNFTNDSAPMHFASAVNAPVAVVYCSTVPGFGFGPLSDKSFLIEIPQQLDCRPCGLHGRRTCPEKHFHCAVLITADQFLKPL